MLRFKILKIIKIQVWGKQFKKILKYSKKNKTSFNCHIFSVIEILYSK